MQQEKRPTNRWRALVVLLLAWNLAAQDFQIRTRVDLVVVPVSVKGDDDKLINGLTKDDFVLLEDGKKQEITNFSNEPVPLSAAVLIDTGLSPASFTRVKDSVIALAGAFSDQDEVAVYRFDHLIVKMTDFTNNLSMVESVLKKLDQIEPSPNTTFIGPGPFSTPGPVINGIPIEPVTRARIPPERAKVLNDAIFAAAEDLRSREVERRKMILVVSDGQNSGNDHSFDDTVNRLLDQGIQVYAVGMDSALLSRRLSVLGSYANATGGDACFVNSQNSLEACYSRSAVQARNQYVLGYVSTNKPPGGAPVFREIKVQVARGDLETRHRKGYFQAP